MSKRPSKLGTAANESGGELSVVVPAYNEVDNIRPLCERLFKALKNEGITGELVVMDDESVGTEKTKAIVAELKKEGYPVRIHARTKREGRGLSSAVLLGFDMAKYENMLCMDGDLQHEPEAVPTVAEPVMSGRGDFSVGSRHVEGGGLGFDWAPHRVLISWAATLLCRPLSASTDPLSGFFCVNKKTLAKGRADCNPIGFKIGLEIMARCRCQKVVDVGIQFQERVAGESKLTMSQNVYYIKQLMSLYLDQWNKLLLLVFTGLFMAGFIVCATLLLYNFCKLFMCVQPSSITGLTQPPPPALLLPPLLLLLLPPSSWLTCALRSIYMHSQVPHGRPPREQRENRCEKLAYCHIITGH